MTPEEFQTHISWPGDRPFYQGEVDVGHENRNEDDDEEDAEI